MDQNQPLFANLATLLKFTGAGFAKTVGMPIAQNIARTIEKSIEQQPVVIASGTQIVSGNQRQNSIAQTH